MAQTPAQKRANEKFAKANEKKMGKPESSYKKKEAQRSPIGPIAVGLLIFVIIAPLLFELSKIFPVLRNFLVGLFAKVYMAIWPTMSSP